MIERKAAGEEIAVQPEAEEPAAAPDLMAALEASLAAVHSGDSDKTAGGEAEDQEVVHAQARLGRGHGRRQEAHGEGEELVNRSSGRRPMWRSPG